MDKTRTFDKLEFVIDDIIPATKTANTGTAAAVVGHFRISKGKEKYDTRMVRVGVNQTVVLDGIQVKTKYKVKFN